MNLDDRFNTVRQHGRHRHHMDPAEFERDLDELQAAVAAESAQAEARFALLQAELAELLARTADNIPASVTVIVR